MIDSNGYRVNVGIIVINTMGQLLWAKRCNSRDSWQFPQGGVVQGEAPVQAMYRELAEELGLASEDVEVLAETQEWHSYLLPRKYRRYHTKPLCIGQRQKWFLLRLSVGDDQVNLSATCPPEFDQWRWVDAAVALEGVIAFKKSVYQDVLAEFSPLIKRC